MADDGGDVLISLKLEIIHIGRSYQDPRRFSK